MPALLPLPVLTDNYVWLLHDGREAVVVDPPEAQPVLKALNERSLQLRTILVTHHHADHVAGIPELLTHFAQAQVYGSASEDFSRELPGMPMALVQEGDVVELLGLRFDVLDVPGHTAGHIAWHCPNPGPGEAPILFCGDTLFSGGCGRIFEGTPAQMLASLDKLAALPGNTRVCCAHEYTLSNLRFARAVEPDNQALQAWTQHCEALRAQGFPTLPSTLATERDINPFLRSRNTAVIQAVRRAMKDAMPAAASATINETTGVADFAALRQWKNEFR
jgi:hydroxyacylglutathione hydrolase